MFRFKNKSKEIARSRAIRNTPFFLTTEDFRESNGIMALYNHSLGLPVDLQSFYWFDDEPAEPDYEVSGNGTAIVTFDGIVRPKSRWWSSVAGLYQLTDLNYRLADDGRVKRTVYHMTTPGGTNSLLDDFSQSVIYHKSKKPIFCYGHVIVASAGYNMAVDMSGIYCDKQCQVGGLGVYAVLRDISRFLEEELGYRYILVSSGGVKGLGADGKVTSELEDDVKRLVMDDADLFKEALNRRSALSGRVDELFDGRVHIGLNAQELGLVDGVMTYRDFLAKVDSGLMPEEVNEYGLDDGRVGEPKSETETVETESEEEEMGNVTVSESFFEKFLSMIGSKGSKSSEEEGKPENKAETKSEKLENKPDQRMLSFAKRAIRSEIGNYVDSILQSKSVTPAQAKTEGLRDSLCWLALSSFISKLKGNDVSLFNECKATVPSLCEYIQMSGSDSASPEDFFSVSDLFGPIVSAFGVVPSAIKVLGDFSLNESEKEEVPKGGGKTSLTNSVFGDDGLPMEWDSLADNTKKMYTATMGRTKEGNNEDVAKSNYEAWRSAMVSN